MNQELQFRLIRETFFFSKKGRVPTEVALKKIDDKIPGLSKWKRGRLLKKCFDGNVKKMKPGSSKNVRDEDRKYHYYGIELALPQRHETHAAGKEEGIKVSAQSQKPNGIEVTGVSREELAMEISCLRRENEKLKAENVKLRENLNKKKEKVENDRKLINKQRKTNLNTVPSIPISFYVNPCDVVNETQVIGRGSYSTCQVVEYKGLTVTKKTLKNKENLVKEKLKACLEDEVKCMLALKAHRNLPHLIGLCVKADNFFLLMNFWGSTIPGYSSLTAAEALRGDLCDIPWIEIAKQIADGLGAIHDSDIIHNDIKGEKCNINKSY